MKTVIFEKGTLVIKKSLVIDGTTFYVGTDYEIPQNVRDDAEVWNFDDASVERDIVYISNHFYLCPEATLIVEGLSDHMNTVVLGTFDAIPSSRREPHMLMRLYGRIWSFWLSIMLKVKPAYLDMTDFNVFES